MEQGGKDGAGAAPLPRVVFLTSPALLASSCPGSPRVFVSLAGPAPLTAVGFGKVAPPRPNPVWLPGGAGREGGREDRERRAWFIHRREEKRWGQAAGAAPALLQRENKTHPPAKQRCLGSEMHFPVRLEPGFYLNFFFFFLLPH